MAQPLSEIQTAAVSALRGDSGVQAAMRAYSSVPVAPTWNIFDSVPANTAFPYLYVADMLAHIGSALAMNKKATDVLLTLHLFSNYPGWKEVDGMVSAIDTVLNQKNLALANGYTWFFCLFDTFIPRVQDTGATQIRHGALRYRMMTQGG